MNDLSIVVSIIDLWLFRIIIILKTEVSLMIYLESCQHVCIVHVLGIHYPANESITLRRVDVCNETVFRDRGDIFH